MERGEREEKKKSREVNHLFSSSSPSLPFYLSLSLSLAIFPSFYVIKNKKENVFLKNEKKRLNEKKKAKSLFPCLH